MQRRAFLLASTGLLVGLAATSASATVLDPLTALKSLYKAAKPKTAVDGNATIATLYDWAGRNLKRKLMANGVCTIPVRSRDVQCSLKFDPAFAGVTDDPPVPSIAADGAGNVRRITVTFNDEDVRFEVIYTFTRAGDRWELSEYEARPPQGNAWRLSELIAR